MRDAAEVVVVTGSTSGIGWAVAQTFASGGAKVVLNSARSPEQGEVLAARLPQSFYLQADVRDRSSMDALVDATIRRWGRLDVLVNSVGATRWIPHADLDAVTDEVWDEVLGVNLLGPWNAIAAAAPALRRHGGVIVNISSLAASKVGGSCIPYAVAKAGLDHLTRLLARALAPDIRVNAVAPGFVETRWNEGRQARAREVAATAPLRRTGRAEDVADACMLLARSTYVTGEVLTVDGGLHL